MITEDSLSVEINGIEEIQKSNLVCDMPFEFINHQQEQNMFVVSKKR